MRTLPSSRRRAAILITACVAIVTSSSIRPRAAVSPGVVISQVYGGGGNSGATLTNDFVELFNNSASPVDLSTWSIQYASSSGSSWQVTKLSGVLQPGHYYLVQEAQGSGGTTALPAPDATGTIAMSASAGKIALVTNQTSLSGTCPSGAVIQDFVGFGTSTNCSEGSPTANLSNTTAAIRLDVCTDGGNNAADFGVASPQPRNTISAVHDCEAGPLPTAPTGVGGANPASVLPGNSALLTVTVTPGTNPVSTGLAATADLTSIGGAGAQSLFDDGTNGDVTAGDKTFSYQATVAAPTAAGPKTLAVTITDAQARTGSAAIQLTVEMVPTAVAIHQIQGPGDRSPLVGERVTTSGIVTGIKTNGFFIQAPDDQADADSTTSEGVFVFTGNVPNQAAIGNLVNVVGNVQEYQSMTEISSVSAVTLISAGHVLPSPVTLTPADTDPHGGAGQLERYEGMRVKVDSLAVVGPTGATTGSKVASNGEFYGVIEGVDRPFREPGIDVASAPIPGIPAGTPRFDGNPERLRVDSDALGAPPLDVAAGTIVTSLVGPLDYGYGSYTIDPEVKPTVTGTVSVVPVPDAPNGQFTVASFNMLNFSATDTDRLDKAALAIRDVMRMPDIIGVQEVDTLATLQALATKVNTGAGSASPEYTAHLLGDKSINVGFMVKSSTVSVTSVTEEGKEATFIDPRSGNPATLNDRPPLVLRAAVKDPRGAAFPFTVVVNHLRSLIDVDANSQAGEFARAKRRAGAEFLAGLIQEYQQNGERVVSVGDYNSFQFSDGYVDVIGTVLGAPAPADQVLLSSADLVTPNLTDLIDMAPPAERYSYVEEGTAQVLDHVLVSANMLPRAASLAFGRMNADFPAIYKIDPARPERLSDHDPAVAYFTFPTSDLGISASTAPPTTAMSGSQVTYTITASNGAADAAATVVTRAALPAGTTVDSITAPKDWTCATEATTVTCTAAELAAHADATLTIVATLDCALPGGDVKSVVTIDAASYDPDSSNNKKELLLTVSNPAPDITSPVATPAALWPVDHKFVPVTIDYAATDNCDPTPVCSLAVSSSEPTDGRGDGRSATDWHVIDSHHVTLRAERSGTGNGRSYTIDVTCSDATGNTSTKNVVVTVPKSQK